MSPNAGDPGLLAVSPFVNPFGNVTQVVVVPLVCKTLLAEDVCNGSNAFKALSAEVCPVPPSVKGRGVPRSNPDFTLKSLSANSVHISPT
jgi:hypothetical protein